MQLLAKQGLDSAAKETFKKIISFLVRREFSLTHRKHLFDGSASIRHRKQGSGCSWAFTENHSTVISSHATEGFATSPHCPYYDKEQREALKTI